MNPTYGTEEQGPHASIMHLDLAVQLESAQKYIDALIAGSHSEDLGRHGMTYFESFVARHSSYFFYHEEEIPMICSHFPMHHTVHQRFHRHSAP